MLPAAVLCLQLAGGRGVRRPALLRRRSNLYAQRGEVYPSISAAMLNLYAVIYPGIYLLILFLCFLVTVPYCILSTLDKRVSHNPIGRRDVRKLHADWMLHFE
jgi:hypothetical protein